MLVTFFKMQVEIHTTCYYKHVLFCDHFLVYCFYDLFYKKDVWKPFIPISSLSYRYMYMYVPEIHENIFSEKVLNKSVWLNEKSKFSKWKIMSLYVK